MLKSKRARADRNRRASLSQQTTTGARLTFRAELMPGRAATERTFTVERVLSSGRVELIGLSGQHTLAEFEPEQ